MARLLPAFFTSGGSGGKSAFAGAHPRRKHLVLTVKSVSEIDSDSDIQI